MNQQANVGIMFLPTTAFKAQVYRVLYFPTFQDESRLAGYPQASPLNLEDCSQKVVDSTQAMRWTAYLHFWSFPVRSMFYVSYIVIALFKGKFTRYLTTLFKT